MQPIPIGPTPTADMLFKVFLVISAIGFLTMIAAWIRYALLKRRGESPSQLLPNFALALMMVGVLVGFTSVGFEGSEGKAIREARTEAIQTEISEHYGLKLSAKEAFYLGYPQEPSKENFEVYGSFERKMQTEGSSFLKNTIYLVWANGSLQLSQSQDGETFTEIQAPG